MRKLKKIIITIILILFVFLMYLVIGGIAPFLKQPSVSENTKKRVSEQKFYSKDIGPDRAAILEDNEEALQVRLKMIAEAKEEIVLSTFDFRSDEAGLDILCALLEAADRGVKVEVFADGFNALLQMEGNNYFYALSANPNVKIIIYNKVNLLTPWKGLGRMHDKYVIMDNKAYLLGGRNTFGYFLGNYKGHKNYDRDVLVFNTEYEKKVEKDFDLDKESSVYQIKKYYRDITSMTCCRLFHDDKRLAENQSVKSATKELQERYAGLLEKYSALFQEKYDFKKKTFETNKITLIHNPTTLYAKEPIVFYTLMELAKKAKTEVKIHTPYIICDNYMYKSLATIGQKTEIMSNSAENNGNLFGAIDYMNNKQKIIDTGVTIKEYEGGISYHGKSMTIDNDMAVVGSFNMDMRSAYIDTELMLAIHSDKVTKQLKENMEKYEKEAGIVKNETEYSFVPDGMEMKKISGKKKNLHLWFGWFFDMFRFLF